MPKPGYKVITVSQETYDELQRLYSKINALLPRDVFLSKSDMLLILFKQESEKPRIKVEDTKKFQRGGTYLNSQPDWDSPLIITCSSMIQIELAA